MEMLTTSTAGVSTALTTVASQMTGVIGDVAPIALGVAGAYMVWRFGIKFFKGLAK